MAKRKSSVTYKKIVVSKNMQAAYEKHNKPKERAYGRNVTRCPRCGYYRGIIHKYRIELCRKCFREQALKLGFKQYS